MEFSLLRIQLLAYARAATSWLWYKLGLSLILVSLAPHTLALHGLAVLFVTDFICGVWLAKRTHTLSSLGMRRGIAKLIIYFLFIGVVSVAEHTTLNTTICTMTAIGLLSATEVLSVIENLVLLGLPVPYASKVLSMVGNKAAAYGVKLDLRDLGSMASANDIIKMIEVTIPDIDDHYARTCTSTYARCWYSFMRGLQMESFTGSHDLMWERLHHGLDRTTVDIRSILMRESVPLPIQDVFLNDWAGDLLKAFSASCKVVTDSEIDPMKKVDGVQDALCLMLFRLVQVAQDRKVLRTPDCPAVVTT